MTKYLIEFENFISEFGKCFNEICIGLGIVGGIFCSLLGGWDVLLSTMVLLSILDYFSGILKAIYNKELSSSIGLKGFIKKIFIFILIALAYSLQTVLGSNIPLREVTITFFIANEGISILENAGEFVPIPDRLKDVLEQLRDKE